MGGLFVACAIIISYVLAINYYGKCDADGDASKSYFGFPHNFEPSSTFTKDIRPAWTLTIVLFSLNCLMGFVIIGLQHGLINDSLEVKDGEEWPTKNRMASIAGIMGIVMINACAVVCKTTSFWGHITLAGGGCRSGLLLAPQSTPHHPSRHN